MRYFGRPTKQDIINANYLLLLPELHSEPKRLPYIGVEEAMPKFKAALEDYGIQCKTELSNKVISQVMVLNSKKTILFRPDAQFTLKEVNALIEHEIGVHMVTTQNASEQQLKAFGIRTTRSTQEHKKDWPYFRNI